MKKKKVWAIVWGYSWVADCVMADCVTTVTRASWFLKQKTKRKFEE